MPLKVDKLITSSLEVGEQNLGTQNVNQFFTKQYFPMVGLQDVNFEGEATQLEYQLDNGVILRQTFANGDAVIPSLGLSFPTLASVSSVISGTSSVANGVSYVESNNSQIATSQYGVFQSNVYQVTINGSGDGQILIQKESPIGAVNLNIRGNQDGFRIQNQTTDNTLDLFKVQNNSDDDIFVVNSEGRTTMEKLNIAASFTPSSTSDPTGNVGDVTWDSSYLYVKTGTGWGRVTLDYMF